MIISVISTIPNQFNTLRVVISRDSLQTRINNKLSKSKNIYMHAVRHSIEVLERKLGRELDHNLLRVNLKDLKN